MNRAPDDTRSKRLAEQLRRNLKRRKQQARERTPAKRPGGAQPTRSDPGEPRDRD